MKNSISIRAISHISAVSDDVTVTSLEVFQLFCPRYSSPFMERTLIQLHLLR